MKEIKLTQGKVALVSDEDFERVNQFKWCASNNPMYRKGDAKAEKWYALRGTVVNGKQKTLYMHRFIMDAPKGKVVDHLDGNGLNNTRENLAVVEHYQNNRHIKFTKNGERKTLGEYGEY